MDYDEAFNISQFDAEDQMPVSISRKYMIQEIILTIFFIIGMCADIVIIYSIFRFKRLRSVPYILLGNWAIIDLCCLAVTPSTYRIISVIRHFSLPHEFMCFLEESGSTFHLTLLLFVIVVATDWFIAAYFGGASEKFRNYYKFIIGSVWLFAIIWTTIFSAVCMNTYKEYIHQELVIVILYGAMFLYIVILQIIRGIQKCRNSPLNCSTITLTLPTAFAITSFLSMLGFYLGSRYIVFETIVTCLLFSSSVVNLSLLYFLDRDFHACLFQIFRRSGDRYEEGITDFDNPIENINDNDSNKAEVRLVFDNNEELLADVD